MAGIPWSDEEIHLLKTYYPSLGVNSMLDMLPRRNLNGIRAKVSQLGLRRDIDHYKTRDYAPSLEVKKQRYIERTGLNINFFKTWTPEMAWVLGVLTSDGNIMDNGGIRLTLKDIDSDCVEKVRDLIAPKQDLATDIGLNAYIRFHVTSRDMKSDLEQLGVTPRKSLAVKPPKIPNSLIPHYLRGILDGDGSVLVGEKFNLRVAFHGNLYIVNYTNKALSHFCGIPLRKEIVRSKGDHVSLVTIEYPTKEALKICEFIYNNSREGIRMDRKYESYKYYLNESQLKDFREDTDNWSVYEDDIILRNYGENSLRELLDLLPSRTYEAVKSRVQTLGIQRYR